MDKLNIKGRNTNTLNDQDFNLVIYQEANKMIDAITALENNSSTLPYKTYSALLTQTGTAAPTEIVLSDNLDNILTITREASALGPFGTFDYVITPTTLFDDEKTFISPIIVGLGVSSEYFQPYIATGIIYISQVTDDTFVKTPIEIRVYN